MSVRPGRAVENLNIGFHLPEGDLGTQAGSRLQTTGVPLPNALAAISLLDAHQEVLDQGVSMLCPEAGKIAVHRFDHALHSASIEGFLVWRKAP